MTPQARGIVLALLAFALYAGHDTLVKLLGGRHAPFQIVFFTVLFAFPLSTVMLIGDREPRSLRPVHPGWMAARMVAIVISSAACFYAFSVLPLADTYAILFAMPLLITLLAIPILGERVRLRRGIAIAVGLVGVGIVLQPGQAELSLGHLAALVSALGSATAATIARRIGRDERNVAMLIYPSVATFVVMGAALPFVYTPMSGLDFGLNALIALLAFAAMLLTIEAYKRAEAALIAPMQYSQMLWAVFYGWLLFDEWPGTATFVGVTLIIASGLYIVFREARGGASENTPVLRTRSRAATPSAPRISTARRMLGLGR
ncbi:MAG: EamA family transporter [Pseudooceanicola sp.]|nr:EamA family transporter [Pseudooceanicola sp.]